MSLLVLDLFPPLSCQMSSETCFAETEGQFELLSFSIAQIGQGWDGEEQLSECLEEDGAWGLESSEGLPLWQKSPRRMDRDWYRG